MTNNQTNSPTLIRKTYFNVKRDAKKLLASGNCRPMLLAGILLGAAAVGASIFLAFAVTLSSPSLSKEENAFFAEAIMYVVPTFFVTFFFPPIYCGLYNVALKNANEERASMSDLFKFCTSPALYKRSIRIFLSSFWFLLVLLLLRGAVFAAVALVQRYTPALYDSVMNLCTSLIFSYTIIGMSVYTTMRKFRYITIPMAIERTDLSWKECSKASRGAGYLSFRMYLPGDTVITYAVIFLSVFTVGILYILYAAPMAVAKKTAYYKALKID